MVVEAKVMGDDLRHWKGKIFGPVSITLEANFLLVIRPQVWRQKSLLTKFLDLGKYADKRLT